MNWLEELVSYAQGNLTDQEREALWMRGVSDEQIASYRLGYLNQHLPPLTKAGHFLEWCRNGQKLDSVFVIPLTNTLGQIKGVQFRHVDRTRSGYMDYFADKNEPVLFGLAQAMPSIWETGVVCIVEGAFDLFPVQRHCPNTVATLTAGVSKGFTAVLKRLCHEVWMLYDRDVPGQKASENFSKFHGSEFKVVIVNLPVLTVPHTGKLAKDPGEVWEVQGDEAFGVFMKRLKDPYNQGDA